MFLKTDLTYNEYGDLTYFLINGTFKNSYYVYSKSNKPDPRSLYLAYYQRKQKVDEKTMQPIFLLIMLGNIHERLDVDGVNPKQPTQLEAQILRDAALPIPADCV